MTTNLAHAKPAQAVAKKKRVFLVDDHPILRRGLVELIQAEPDLTVCGESSTLAETYSMVAKDKPDMVVTDISLEGNNGLELLKELSYRWPDLKLLAYSMHDEDIYAERALRSGAKGYIAKDSSPKRLVDAIRVVLDGKVYLSEKMSEKLLGKLVGANGAVKALQSPVESLSDRELEVFQYLGKGSTTGQIAETLCLSVKTIETYREHIKHKLSIKSGPELIRYAVEWSIQQGG